MSNESHATREVTLTDRLSDLKRLSLTFHDCIAAFGVKRDDTPAALRAFDNINRDGELEIDDITVISESTDGSYVLAWVWSADDDNDDDAD